MERRLKLVQNKYTVLGGIGSVECMSSTPGGDLLVVNAARCSFDKEHTEFDKDKDARLINFLAREKHLLPFRHPNVTLRLTLPIYVLRQLGKHQVGFSWSEVSRRYIKTGPLFHLPLYRLAADNVKQGSSDRTLPPVDSIEAENISSFCFGKCEEAYFELLYLGVAPEQARVILPQSMITTTVTTGSLLGWNSMYSQRSESHTQKETQEYAVAIGKIMNELYPISWRALCEHSS